MDKKEIQEEIKIKSDINSIVSNKIKSNEIIELMKKRLEALVSVYPEVSRDNLMQHLLNNEPNYISKADQLISLFESNKNKETLPENSFSQPVSAPIITPNPFPTPTINLTPSPSLTQTPTPNFSNSSKMRDEIEEEISMHEYEIFKLKKMLRRIGK